MSQKLAPEDRRSPRQIRMDEAEHATAVKQAAAAGKTFSDYVRDLIVVDGKRRARK